jgi:hypothetical protein
MPTAGMPWQCRFIQASETLFHAERSITHVGRGVLGNEFLHSRRSGGNLALEDLVLRTTKAVLLARILPFEC